MTEPPAGWDTPGDWSPAPRTATSTPAPGTAYEAASPRQAGGDRRGPGAVPLRPLGLGELLDGAVAVVRSYPRPVLAMAAVVAVVTALLQLLVTLTLLAPLTGTDASSLTSSSNAFDDYLGTAAVGTALTLLVSAVTSAVLAGLVVVVVSKAVFAASITLRESWTQLRPRLPALLGTALVVGLASYGSLVGGIALAVLASKAGVVGVLLGVLLGIGGAVGAVALYLRWSLAVAVCVLERQSVRRSLTRSSVLVHRSAWRIFGVLLLTALIALFVGLVLQLPFALLGYNPFQGLAGAPMRVTTGQALLGAVAGALSSTLVAPFSAGVRALLYVDRRMRAEGLDVSLVAAAAQARG